MANEERKIPQLKRQQKWKNNNKWLNFTKSGMICTMCCEWEKQIIGSSSFSDTFLKGSTNYRLSAQHRKSVELS